MENQNAISVDFDLSDLNAIDEAQFVAHMTPTVRWIWVYAGPGHPKAIAVAKRRAAVYSKENAAKEQALVNRKKWKSEEQTYEEMLEDNVTVATERLLDWYIQEIGTGKRLDHLVTLEGKPVPFSEESARMYLRDPRRNALLVKVLEWLGDEKSFTKRGANRSESSPGAPSS